MRLLHPEVPWIGGDEIADNELVIAATRGELSGLNNGLNEALEAVDDWEFQTRLGITPDQAEALCERIREVLREAFRPE